LNLKDAQDKALAALKAGHSEAHLLFLEILNSSPSADHSDTATHDVGDDGHPTDDDGHATDDDDHATDDDEHDHALSKGFEKAQAEKLQDYLGQNHSQLDQQRTKRNYAPQAEDSQEQLKREESLAVWKKTMETGIKEKVQKNKDNLKKPGTLALSSFSQPVQDTKIIFTVSVQPYMSD